MPIFSKYEKELFEVRNSSERFNVCMDLIFNIHEICQGKYSAEVGRGIIQQYDKHFAEFSKKYSENFPKDESIPSPFWVRNVCAFTCNIKDPKIIKGFYDYGWGHPLKYLHPETDGQSFTVIT